MSKVKNFSIRSKELKINGTPNTTTKGIREFLLNKKIKITGVTGSHNYGPIGTVLTLDNPNMTITGGSGSTWTNLNCGAAGKNQISFTCFSIIEITTVDEIKEEIARLQQEKKDITAKIGFETSKLAYMKENKLKEFDDVEFKAYQTLTLLEDKKLSKLDKARLISKLIGK